MNSSARNHRSSFVRHFIIKEFLSAFKFTIEALQLIFSIYTCSLGNFALDSLDTDLNCIAWTVLSYKQTFIFSNLRLRLAYDSFYSKDRDCSYHQSSRNDGYAFCYRSHG